MRQRPQMLIAPNVRTMLIRRKPHAMKFSVASPITDLSHMLGSVAVAAKRIA